LSCRRDGTPRCCVRGVADIEHGELVMLRLQMAISSCCVRGDEHEEVQVLGVPVSAATTSSSSASQFKKARRRYDNTSCLGTACLGTARWQDGEKTTHPQGAGAHRVGDLAAWSRASDVVAPADEGPGSLGTSGGGPRQMRRSTREPCKEDLHGGARPAAASAPKQRRSRPLRGSFGGSDNFVLSCSCGSLLDLIRILITIDGRVI
jgi:hypothetical protein